MLDSEATDKCCFSFYFFLKLKYSIFTILCFRCIAKRFSYSYTYAAAAAAAKSLQSCPTLCDPRDGSPPGSSVPGILQARTLEWVAISFSNAWKWKVKVRSLSCARLLATPWIAARQASLSITNSWSSLRLKSIAEKAMAPHSSTLAWKIPWTEEPGRLQSMGSLRVRHDWATSLSLFTFMHWRRKWQATPVFLPGESQGRGSLMGCHLWGRTELDTTEAN